jgi:hypothetical protein
MTLDEGVTGTGFEVTFEAGSLNPGCECYVQNQFPWPVIGGVATLAGVVLFEALL